MPTAPQAPKAGDFASDLMADLGLESRPHAEDVHERIVEAFERYGAELMATNNAQIVERIAEAAGAVA